MGTPARNHPSLRSRTGLWGKWGPVLWRTNAAVDYGHEVAARLKSRPRIHTRPERGQQTAHRGSDLPLPNMFRAQKKPEEA